MLIPVISIPKSGTYLVNSIIREVCLITHQSFNYKFSYHPLVLVVKKDIPWLREEVAQLEKLDVDMFPLLGHWRHLRGVYDIFSHHPKLFVYRHPLDVAVSFIEGAIKGLFVDMMTQELEKCSNKEEMYRKLLKGVEGIGHPWASGFRSIIENRIGWLDYTDVTAIRFEDLRRGDPTGIPSALNIPRKTVKHAMRQVFKKPARQTFRKGIVGAWKDEMPKDICSEYIDKIGDLILKLGYGV